MIHPPPPPPVPAVLVPSVHRLLLCRPAAFAQSLRLRGQTPGGGHDPLLPVPEQDLCECPPPPPVHWYNYCFSVHDINIGSVIFRCSVPRAGLGHRGRLQSVEKRGRQGREGPDSGGPPAQGLSTILSAGQNLIICSFLGSQFTSISIFPQNKMLQRENVELKRRLAAQTH